MHCTYAGTIADSSGWQGLVAEEEQAANFRFHARVHKLVNRVKQRRAAAFRSVVSLASPIRSAQAVSAAKQPATPPLPPVSTSPTGDEADDDDTPAADHQEQSEGGARSGSTRAVQVTRAPAPQRTSPAAAGRGSYAVAGARRRAYVQATSRPPPQFRRQVGVGYGSAK